MKHQLMRRLVLAAPALLLATALHAQEKFIVVTSTTSTEQSGLFTTLLPAFEKKTGIKVRVVAVGTGPSARSRRRGDADVVFVHDKAAEEKFVADGFGVERKEVMYNDFIIIGPKADPAKARGKDVLDGMKKIEATKSPFVSRGDKSGTHAAELRYWKAAGVDAEKGRSNGSVSWYRECGWRHGPRAQHGSFDECLRAGRPRHLVVVQEPSGPWHRCRRRQQTLQPVRRDAGQPGQACAREERTGSGLCGLAGLGRRQKTIADYKIGGEQLFFPNAK